MLHVICEESTQLVYGKSVILLVRKWHLRTSASIENVINPLLHRYSFLLQQTTFENILTKEEIALAGTISQFFPLPQCFQSFPT